MNPAFRHSFDTQKDDTTKPGVAGSDKAVHSDDYKDAGHIRNLCFVFRDGKRLFLNYSYLVSGEFKPDESSMTLEYTSHIVILKGIYLEGLYYEIMQQLIKQIICADARYNSLTANGMPAVNEIVITKINS